MTSAVTSDPDHLHRILVNYLSNALRYGSPPVRIAVDSWPDTVEIRVCDAGASVSPDLVDRLFTRFARVEGHGGGVGLGLSIVTGLADLNGGRAFYEALEPVGSCFGIELPRTGDGEP